ncbi:MAG: type II toxin-antitoxin system RelE/ParE family toxin [Acidobacteriota bacterium]
MSKRRVSIRLLRAAEEDLNEILEYIAVDNPKAAEATLEHIQRTLTLLTRRPHLGRIPTDEELVRMGYRVLVVGDYLAFYTLEDRSVLVHRIIHGARDYLRLL